MSADAELEEILTHCDYTMKIAFDLLEQHRKRKLPAARCEAKISMSCLASASGFSN